MAGEDDIVAAIDAAEEAGAPEDRAATPLDRTCAQLLRNDTGNAERLIARFGRDLVFHPALGWLAWAGSHWDAETGEMIALRHAQGTARAILTEAKAIDPPDREALIEEGIRAGKGGRELDGFVKAALARHEAMVAAHLRHGVTSGNTGKIAGMLRQAEPHLMRPPEAFDANAFVFNAANRTLHLKPDGGFEARPQSRADLVTKVGGCPFEPRAGCPRFEAFLARIQPDPAMRGFLQRWAGYLLTGSIAEQVMAVLHGSGANGKGTLMNAWRTVMGGYAITMNIESFGEGGRRDGSAASPDLVRMRGARMIATSDAPSNFTLAEGVIKQATGEEPMTARQLQRAVQEFLMTGKVMIPCNPKPRIAGTDHGIWRRVLLVPFAEQIAKAEAEAFRRDHGDLSELLRAEAPGILNWMLAGYRAWRREGLAPPDAVRAATEDYRHESDPVGEFLTVWTDRVAEADASSAALFEKFVQFSKDNALPEPKSAVSFGKKLKEHGLESRKSHGIKRWLGVLLRLSPRDDAPRAAAAAGGGGAPDPGGFSGDGERFRPSAEGFSPGGGFGVEDGFGDDYDDPDG